MTEKVGFIPPSQSKDYSLCTDCFWPRHQCTCAESGTGVEYMPGVCRDCYRYVEECLCDDNEDKRVQALKFRSESVVTSIAAKPQTTVTYYNNYADASGAAYSTGGSAANTKDTTQHWTFTKRDPCKHYGNRVLWQGHNIRLLASGKTMGIKPMLDAIHLNLIPDLYALPKGVTQTPHDLFPDMDKYVRTYRELAIDWADYDVPDLGREFWVGVARTLHKKARAQDKPLSVLAFCLGGHGRTGTACAILLGLWGVNNPIAFVRKNYCKHAIETNEQEAYVYDMLKKGQ